MLDHIFKEAYKDFFGKSGNGGTFKEHIPPYVSGYEPEQIKYESTEDLLKNKIFDHWRNQKDFYRFSLSNEGYLMAELDNGRHWWVTGIVSGICDLPNWEPKDNSTDEKE